MRLTGLISKYRVLGFDFGLKRIGVASGNTQTQTAQSIAIISSNDGTPDWQSLDRLIEEWRPEKLVVGLPVSMAGDETDISRKARGFGDRLSKRYGLNIDYCDERLSSNQANTLIRELTPKGKRIRKKSNAAIDHIAAQLILETYFQND